MRRVGPILYSDADCIGAHIAMASQSSRAYIRFYSAAFCRKLYTGADKLLTLSGMRVKGWPLQTIHQPFTNHSPTVHQPFTEFFASGMYRYILSAAKYPEYFGTKWYYRNIRS